MASPVVAGVTEGGLTAIGTSVAVTLPGSGSASDLYLIIADKGSTSATWNALTDWTESLDEALANGLVIVRYTGTGVPSNPTFTQSASTRTVWIAYRITGADKPTAPQIGTTGTGTSATPDPPSVTPTGGLSKDYLFIAFAGMAGEEADDDTWGNTPPTNYTPSPPRQKTGGTTGTNIGGLILSAERALTTGAAENPGTFGVDVSAAWRSQTIIIHPGNTAGGVLFTVAPSFPAGALVSDQTVAGSLFTRAPSFGTGAVTPVNTLAGILLSRTPTFGVGSLSNVNTLAGLLFSRAPTFGAGAVVADQPLAGVLFSRAPTFGTGRADFQISGVLFSRSPIFGVGVVQQTQSLAGVLFTRSPVFDAGIATQAQIVSGVLFTRSPTFPVGAATAGPVTLNGVLLTSTPTFGTGAIHLILVGATFTRVPVFEAGAMLTAGQVAGVLFARPPVFGVGFIEIPVPFFAVSLGGVSIVTEEGSNLIGAVSGGGNVSRIEVG